MKHYLKYYKEQILSMMIVSYKTVSLSYNHKNRQYKTCKIPQFMAI